MRGRAFFHAVCSRIVFWNGFAAGISYTIADYAFKGNGVKTGKKSVSKRPASRQTETAHALHERVKELTCLYSITQLSEKLASTPDRIFSGIVDLIPPAWQYPDIAAARIVLDGRVYSTPGFSEHCQKQAAAVVVDGHHKGSVEVIYTNTMPELDEGPFLNEERNLLEAIARQVAFVVERQNAEEEKAKLQKLLMHADRLATIGQLAAGVAHELNEPLASILGFAQLAKKAPALPQEAGRDLDKIVNASLHAREIIKKLLLFARQTPSAKCCVNFNDVVEEALGMFEHRLKKEDIELAKSLCPQLPLITADAGQMTQVIVNLVVNAIQAMPDGGTLTVKTHADAAHVICIVKDTGEGMTEEVLDRIFVPFFTTKGLHQGTGLGLSVVHGIVTSHGGTIEAHSSPGNGAQFEIRIPIESVHTAA